MIDLSEIEDFANESGNNFHCTVLNAVKKKGWETLVSPYYMDSATDKPREIDITAERLWNRSDYFDGTRCQIYSRLFIECKYIAQPTVFWFSKKDINSATKWLTTNTPLREGNEHIKEHHYYKDTKVAKLFATKKQSNAENEVIYKALNQCLNALVALRQSKLTTISVPDDGSVRSYVNMPVIICNSFDNFFAVNIDTQDKPTQIKSNFQLEVNYAYLDNNGKSCSNYFLVDIVAFDLLNEYFETLKNDQMAILKIL